MFMMPTFINVMQVYAMCNLHDISWGNRPNQHGSQGVEAVASTAIAQDKLKLDYQMFRAHFLYFWLIANALYGGFATTFTKMNLPHYTIGDHLTFLDMFAAFVASIVVFKFLFALLYQLKWNCRRGYCKNHRKSILNMDGELQRIKIDKQAYYSTYED